MAAPQAASSGGTLRGGPLDLPCESYATEDLAALGQVPVAERRGGDHGVGRPGAAAQNAVALLEEDLGVLPVGVGAEAGVAGEMRGGPLPDGAGALECGAAVFLGRGRRPLPLELGGQAGPLAAGEGVGLEPGDVHHGRVVV